MTEEGVLAFVRAVLLVQGIIGVVMLIGLVVWRDQFKR